MCRQSCLFPTGSLVGEYVTLRGKKGSCQYSVSVYTLYRCFNKCSPIRHVSFGSIFSTSAEGDEVTCPFLDRISISGLEREREMEGVCAIECTFGGIHSHLVIVAWWGAAGISRPEDTKMHWPPGRCVAKRHQHLYVCGIPCMCKSMWYGVQCQQASIITSTRGRHLTPLSSETALSSTIKAQLRIRRWESRKGTVLR